MKSSALTRYNFKVRKKKKERKKTRNNRKRENLKLVNKE
jgi:hypothetical protein